MAELVRFRLVKKTRRHAGKAQEREEAGREASIVSLQRVARKRKRRKGIRIERGIEAGGWASGWGEAVSGEQRSLTPTSPAYRPYGLRFLHHHDTIVPPRPPPATTHPNLSMRLISHISLAQEKLRCDA